jgi:hypothetical protein
MKIAQWFFCAWLLIGIHSNGQMAMLFEVFPTQEACQQALDRNKDNAWTAMDRLECVEEKETRVFVMPRSRTEWRTRGKTP